MNNTINHKCPCCGYATEYDWINNEGQFETVVIQGNEPFVIIKSDDYSFKTDVERKVSWGLSTYENAILLGCPKCGCVSFIKD